MSTLAPLVLAVAVLADALLGFARSIETPEPGALLVATEEIADPRFKQSVILLVKHEGQGSWGLIINKPTDVHVAEVLPVPGEPLPHSHVFYGGPVLMSQLQVVYPRKEGDAGGKIDVPGLELSHSPEEIVERLRSQAPDVRVFAGYAGWAPGQLTVELAHGHWRVFRGNADAVFSKHPDRLWQHLTNVLKGITV